MFWPTTGRSTVVVIDRSGRARLVTSIVADVLGSVRSVRAARPLTQYADRYRSCRFVRGSDVSAAGCVVNTTRAGFALPRRDSASRNRQFSINGLSESVSVVSVHILTP